MKITTLSVLLLVGRFASAQIFYNERLDKKSQDALTRAKATTSGAVFDRELENLDTLFKSSSENVFRSANVQMSADLAGFFSWQHVGYVIERIARDLGTAQSLSADDQNELAASKKQLQTDQKAASSALEDFRTAAQTVGKNFPQTAE